LRNGRPVGEFHRCTWPSGNFITSFPAVKTPHKSTYPYFVKNARPSIFEVINKYGIELLVTTGSGYTEFPINLIKDIPIIMLNVFGSPSTQKNIVYQVCMSHAVSEKLKPIVEADIIKVMYIPQEFPPQDAIEKGEEFRASLGILPTDMVFGRIGRPTDEIFDPIGIRAFQAVVKKNPDAHYIIMAPAKSLLKILSEESIPNVHIVPTASMDPWVFHNSIDALAHFRRDGESFGLNIAESMFCSKPIISHESSIWNAHLEYLDNSFSRVAEVDNVSQYATYMQEFIDFKKSGHLDDMGKFAYEKAVKLFHISNSIKELEGMIDASLL
jgi:hypothetical protein